MTVLVEKCPARPPHRGEDARAIVQIKHVRLPQLDEMALDQFETLGPPARDLRTAIDQACRNLSTAAQDRNLPVIGHVEIQVSVPIDVGQCQRMRAGLRDQPGRRRDIGKTTLAEIEKTGIGSTQRADQQIEQPVAVHVGKDHALGRHVAHADAGAGRRVHKTPLSVIAEKAVGPFGVGEIQVTESVAVEIAGRHAAAVHQVLVRLCPGVSEAVGEEDAGLLGTQQGEAGPTRAGHGQFRLAIALVLGPLQGLAAGDGREQNQRGGANKFDSRLLRLPRIHQVRCDQRKIV